MEEIHSSISSWIKDIEINSGNELCNNDISSFQVNQLLCNKALIKPLLYLSDHLFPQDKLQGVRLQLQNSNLQFGMINGSSDNKKGNSQDLFHENCTANLLSEAQELEKLNILEESLVLKEREIINQINLRGQSFQEARLEIEQLKTWYEEIKILTKFPPNSKDVVVKGKCKGNLGTILKDLKNIRLKLLTNNEHLSDFASEKHRLLYQVDELLKYHHSSLIYNALSLSTSDASSLVIKKSHHFEFSKDAHNYLNSLGSEVNASSAHTKSNASSIKYDLLQMDANHIKIRLHTHNILTNLNSTRDAFNCYKEKVDLRTSELYGSLSEQISILQMSKIKLAGTKEALTKASSLYQSMVEDVEFAKQTQQNLLQLYNDVQNFKSETKRNILMIKSLIMHGSSAWDNICLEQNSIFEFAEKVFKSFDRFSSPLLLSYSKIFAILSKIPLGLIKSGSTSDNKRLTLNSLSPCNLSEKDQSMVRSLSTFPCEWIFLLESLRQKKRLKSHMDDLITTRQNDLEKMSTKCRDSQHASPSYVNSLCRQAKEHDKIMESKFEPLLQEFENLLSLTERDLKSLKSVVNNYLP